MPIRKEVWECEICPQIFSHKNTAIVCEEGGIIIPRCNMGDRVIINFPKGTRVGTVTSFNHDIFNEPYNPHRIEAYQLHLDREYEGTMRYTIKAEQITGIIQKGVKVVDLPEQKRVQTWDEFHEICKEMGY